MTFSFVKFSRSLIGLVLAPIVGGGVTLGLYGLANVIWASATGGAGDRAMDYLTNSLVAGLQTGLQFGIAPALLLGWPLHLALLRTGFIHLQTYFTFGAALSVLTLLVITQYFNRTSVSAALPFQLFLLIAAAGAVAGAVFWLIRRPDRDEPISEAPPPPQAQ